MGRVDFAALYAAVETGRSLPEAEWPDPVERDNDPPQVSAIAAILGAVLGDLCSRWSITPNLVANPQDLRKLARSRLNGSNIEDSHLAHGWRRDHVLPELLAVLDGKRWLRIADVNSETPLAYQE
jgi:ribonuclease D